MIGIGKHGHIHAQFRNQMPSYQPLYPRDAHQGFHLLRIRLHATLDFQLQVLDLLTQKRIELVMSFQH
jgi:hypothetical protein